MILLSGTLGEELAVDCIKHGRNRLRAEKPARPPARRASAGRERNASLREAEEKAVQALRESEERYRTLVENAPEAIVVLDVEKNRFIDCNDNALRLFRMTRRELLRARPGRSKPRHPTRRAGRRTSRIRAADRRGARRRHARCFEWVHRNSQGDEIPCEIHLVGLPSPARQARPGQHSQYHRTQARRGGAAGKRSAIPRAGRQRHIRDLLGYASRASCCT